MLQAIRNFLALALLIAAGAALAGRDQALCAGRPRQRRRAAHRDVAQGDGADRRENQGKERRAIAQGRGRRGRRRQFQGRERAARRGGRQRPEGRRVVAGARPARRASGRRAGGRTLRFRSTRPDRGLRRLSARQRRRCASRSPRAARQSLRPPGDVAPGPRRLSRQPRPARRRRHAQDLRGHARKARLPHPRLQGRQRILGAAGLLQLLRVARAQDGLFALCRGRRRRQFGHFQPRISRFASKASSTASAMRSSSARACRRRSASRCSSRPITKFTCATDRRRRISPARPTCCRARASSARR